MFWLVLIFSSTSMNGGVSSVQIDKYQHFEQCQYAGEAALTNIKGDTDMEYAFTCVPVAINEKETP